MNLANKIAIVTGATSGIGRAIAHNLAEAGVHLIVTGRREERLRALADELSPANKVVALPADICDPETPALLLSTAIERFGHCDIVLNGAGSAHVDAIENLDIDSVCLMIRTNVEAATRMAYTALRHFRERDSGYLINISSVLGTKVRSTAGAYAATKHAIEALSEALRMEVAGSGIGVSVIQPGLTESELQDHFEHHPRDLLSITQPLSPEDVARCVRFILEQPSHMRIPVMMMLPGEQAM